MNIRRFALVGAIASAVLAVGCTQSHPVSYGGSDPKGDYIVVEIDKANSKVRRQNLTTGEDSGWLAYAAVPTTDSMANGFSILNRVEIGGGKFALFAEFERAAVVYQVFNAGTPPTTDGNPVYAVYRQQVDKALYYERAYNWMKFSIDDAAASDMECGFAAFDTTAAQGLLYGAGYSNRAELNGQGLNGSGVQSINSTGTMKVDTFTYDSAAVANVMWDGAHPNDRSYAVTMVGTPSTANVLDFGLNIGGGMGLAIQQALSKDWSASYAGTFFTLVYEYDVMTGTRTIEPFRVALSSTGGIDVYDKSGTAAYQGTLVSVEDFTGGPNGEPVKLTFATVSGNAGAQSPWVQGANVAHGTFISQKDDGTRNSVLTVIFDPDGRFYGFTMFDKASGGSADPSDYRIRFGFGLKDPGYTP